VSTAVTVTASACWSGEIERQPIHHSANEPSGCRQVGLRQAWPR
jgi:hypothetical protein